MTFGEMQEIRRAAQDGDREGVRVMLQVCDFVLESEVVKDDAWAVNCVSPAGIQFVVKSSGDFERRYNQPMPFFRDPADAPFQTAAALIPQISQFLLADYITRETLAATMRRHGINFRDDILGDALREMIEGGDVDEDGDFVRSAMAVRLSAEHQERGNNA